MLIKFFKRIVSRAGAKDDERDAAERLQQAHEIALAGDNRGAISAYREVLEREPTNIEALNGLGACLAYVGNTAEARQTFELAYSLDDTYIPAMVNHGKLLIDDNRAEEGLAFIRRAKICAPDFSHADAVYAGLCLRLGDPARARRHQLKSWLANFDHLRLANCYLFWTSYDDVDEALIAAEHRFWAETLVPPAVQPEAELPALPSPPRPGERKVRLGFWSPDFRGHSVRFFFRPLFDALDRDRFETFLYHDAPGRDGHTDAVQARADHFHDCAELNDADLHALVRSHQLDVLVELAGHSSHNRVSLLAHRLATVQVTALGYPPTDGLRSVDAKIVDRHIVTPDSARYFAEEPVALASSFWCFDPKEPIAVAAEPPVARNGHVTFACMGNIAKITQPLARAWIDILAAVPDSRLLIRSISFEDALAERSFALRLADWGLPMDRVDLRRPEGGVRFFASYDEIDVILDTFPFNGGTTTCFATYMGVPVVSLVGESLVGRMGLSILSNAGEPGLAVRTVAEYTAKAIAVARDVDFLRRYKAGIRERLAGTALGNETLHAREFEQACLDLLERRRAGTLQWTSRIDTLPSAEIMRRAYGVLRRGNEGGARRIVEHCLREYPDCGAAHLLLAQMLAWQQRVPEAVAYLQERVQAFSTQDQVSTWLSLARMHLLQDERGRAAEAVAAAVALPQGDPFEADQGQLVQAALAPARASAVAPDPTRTRAVRMLVPCDDVAQFERLRAELLQGLDVPPGWSLAIERCSEARRVAAYQASLDVSGWDVLVLLQKNVRLAGRAFLERAVAALAQADIVGFAGATRWTRLDWRNDDFAAKAGAFIGSCAERAGWAELQVVGHGREAVRPGMAVLDGAVLVVSRQAAASGLTAWDEELVGAQTLLEEAWVHAAGRAGARLAVHRGLGVAIDAATVLDAGNRAEASVRCAEQLGVDPFDAVQDDFLALAVPAADARQAAAIADRYLGLA